MSSINTVHTLRVLAASVLLSTAIGSSANAGPVNVNIQISLCDHPWLPKWVLSWQSHCTH